MTHQQRFLITMYIVIGVACAFIPERAHSVEPKFNIWQVLIKPDGYPKLRYLDLDTQTSFGFTYIDSDDCADLKLEVRRFVEGDVVIPDDTVYAGGFFVNNRRFDFPAQVPQVKIAATLQVVQAVWTPSYSFYSELINADLLFWRDNTMPVGVAVTIPMVGFAPMLNISMEICHSQFTIDNPPNTISILPMYSAVSL